MFTPAACQALRTVPTLTTHLTSYFLLQALRVVPTLDPSPHPLYKKLYKQLGATWVDDAAAPACLACARPFDQLFRRHHCRLLGLVSQNYLLE